MLNIVPNAIYNRSLFVYFLKFGFYIGVWLINDVVSLRCNIKVIQLYIHIYPLFFNFFSHLGYFGIFGSVPCAVW